MKGKHEYLALYNPVPAMPEAAQREMLAKFQPAEDFTVDKDGPYDSFIRLVRPPRIVLVAYPALLAEQSGDQLARRDSMIAMKEAIRRTGTYAQDADGNRTDKDWHIMRPAGEKMCGRLAQGAKSALNAKRGAKRWADTEGITAAIRAAMKDEWYVIDGKRTVDDAVKAIKRKFRKLAPGRTVLYREFGDPVMKKR